MTQFTGLVDEILTEILLYLINDKPSLCSLAIQSQRLNTLCRPILVRYVHLLTGPPAKKYHLFLRSVKECPALASMVQHIHIGWSEGDRQVHNCTNTILEQLPALRSLKLHAWYDDSPFNYRFLKHSSMDLLTDIDIDIRYFSMADMNRFFFLKRLNKMSISWIERPTVPNLPNGHSYRSSSVTKLDLGPNLYLLPSILTKVLKFPAKLITLSTALPGRDKPDQWIPQGRTLTTQLSPVLVPIALEPVRWSLEDLTLIDENCIWTGHDGTRTDLNHFSSLNILKISSLCYFPSGVSQRDNIAHLLPPSLKKLDVSKHTIMKLICLANACKDSLWPRDGNLPFSGNRSSRCTLDNYDKRNS